MRVSVLPADPPMDSPVVRIAAEKADSAGGVDSVAQDAAAGARDDVYDVYTRSEMFQAMKPLFLSLRVFGLYHTRTYGSLTECNQRERSKKCGQRWKRGDRGSSKSCITPSMAYSWLITLLLTANYLRHFAMFTYGDNSIGPEFFLKSSTILWLSICMVNVIVFLRATCRYESIPKFFIEWQSLNDSLPDLNLGRGFVRKVSVVVVSVAWLLLLWNTSLMSYFAASAPALAEPMLSPLRAGDDHVLVMQVILITLLPLVSAAWTFGMAIDFLFCYVLYKIFESWNERFRGKCAAGLSSAEFVHEQVIHQRICRLVSSAEDFLSLYKASSFVANLGMVLFLLYNFVYMSSVPSEFLTPLMIASSAAWSIIAFLALGVTCCSGVMVNVMAHSVYDDVVELQPTVEPAQIQLFLTRLSGSSIGFSALGMFVFDKAAILTAVGMLLTYFIVLLQFNPGVSSAAETTCVCNCTAGCLT